MTIQEAMKMLGREAAGMSRIIEDTKEAREYIGKEIEKLEIAVDCMKKQIPYKPTPYKGYYGKCKCGVVFLDKTTNYCGNCGQRLDWSDNK